MSEHTQLPWNVRDHKAGTGGRHIWVEGGPAIGETRAGPYKRQILEDEDYDEKAADAALIVRAVNSHEALVKALTELLDACERMGTFSNGVVHNGIDEGNVYVAGLIDQARDALTCVGTAKGTET